MNNDREPRFGFRDRRNQSPHQKILDDTGPFRKWISGCFGVFLLLFFVAWYAILGFIFEEASNGRDAVNWPTTSGQVAETKVTSRTSHRAVAVAGAEPDPVQPAIDPGCSIATASTVWSWKITRSRR